MAEEVIGLLFGVEGVGVNGASGQEIVKGLTQIVNEINSGKSTVPKVKLQFDTGEATKAVDDLKKQLKDIEKIASIKVAYSNGGKSGKVGKGGSITQELQSEMKKFVELQKQISSMKVKIGKLEIDGGDVGVISAYTGELERLEDQYMKTMHAFMKKLTGNADNISIDNINEWDAQLTSLKQIEEATIAAARAKKESALADEQQAQIVEKQKNKYEKLLDVVNNYYKSVKEGQKLASEYSGITQDKDGTLHENGNSDFTAKVKSINAAVAAFKKFNIEIQRNEVGVSTEQFQSLIQKVIAGSESAAINAENVARKSQNAWVDYASKVRDEINRTYDVISKNPEVRELADEVRQMASASSGDVGDLKNKFDELRNKIHQTGADVETWGDKFKKTFAGKVRSALAGAITATFTKYLREVYQNVIKIDEAMTDLQIASGKTREEVKALTKGYASLAQQLGATTTEVAKAADTWLRQGYSAEESSILIRNSMMLSKLGQMESAEASTALTSAMKGYGIAVQDSTSIVDKFTKVDMEAAASAGDIATAMAETSASAKLAGVSMDTLIGYIATVKEVTQDGAESVGTFYKTLFARMNNVKAGNFVDDETGEALNDVEAVLGELGIALRDANGQFLASSKVLDEVASRWEAFDSVQQHAIATAMAGTRQQEKFLVLMQNYDTAMKYASSATKAAGTSTEKYSAYTESLDGKLNSLTATFEELSVTMLDSDLVGGFLVAIAGLLSALNDIMSLGDGFIVKAALVTLAVIGLTAAVGALKKGLGGALTSWGDFVSAVQLGAGAIGTALKSLISNPYLYLVVLITTFTTFADKMPDWSLLIVGAILAIGTTIVIVIKKANAEIWKFMSSNPLGWILLAITAIGVGLVALIKSFAGFSNASTKAKEKAVAAAKESKEAYEEVKGELDSLNNKLDESKERFKELQELSNSGRITLVEQQEMDKLTTTISQLEAEKKVLEDIAAIKRKDAEEDAASAIQSIMSEKLSDAYTQEDNTFWNGVGRVHASILSWGISDAFGYGISDWSVKKTTAEEYANDILGNWQNATEQQRNYVIDFYDQLSEQKDMLSYHSGENLAQWQKDCNDAYNTYYEFTHKMLIAQGNFDTVWNSIITMERFGGIQDTLANIAEQRTLSSENFEDIYNTNPQLKEFVDYLTSIGFFAWDDQNKIQGLVNQINSMATVTKREARTFLDILDGIQGSYDTLSKAIDDMNEYGYVSADTLSTLLKEYPNLEKYLTFTANGYTIAKDALDDYIKSQRDAYEATLAMAEEGTEEYETAHSELERFLAAIATLELSDAIKKETEALESEKSVWEGQLDRYKDLIDIRKGLLESYAEELEYKKELDKKQSNVSKLETQLSVARLDKSAAGQARVRELEAELKEAQEELEDFTLEHAIETLTDQLDNQHKQYEDFIETKVSEITSAIKEVTDTIRGNVDSPVEETTAKDTEYKAAQDYVTSNGMLERDKKSSPNEDNGDYVKLQERYFNERSNNYNSEAFWRKPTYRYHKGGLVGNIATLSSSEEFAKLLKGEFVSTPAQMKRFMEETLPKIANYSATGGSNEFNAPLIEILCESVTTEALPELKHVVNEAVKEIKKQLDSGMSRTGFKRAPTKRLT